MKTVNNMRKKLTKLCKEVGELHYKKLDNNYDCNYNSMDIMSKKLIIQELINTAVILRIYGGNSVELLNRESNIHKLLEDYDELFGISALLVTNTDINRLFDKSTIWLKLLKVNENNEKVGIDFLNDIKNLDMLKKYLLDPIIMYAIKNDLPIPYVDFNNKKEVEQLLKRLNSLLSLDELVLIVL